MFVAVAEIHHAANSTPDEETYPGFPGKIVHEIAAGKHCHRGDEPDRRTAESARQVRLGEAQYHDADRCDEEGTERADIGHFSNDSDGGKACDKGNENCAENRNDIRCLIAFMDFADLCRNHAITAHRKENTCLSIEQHEEHCRNTGNGADTNDGRADVIAYIALGKSDRLRTVELRVRNNASEYSSYDDIERSTDDE